MLFFKLIKPYTLLLFLLPFSVFAKPLDNSHFRELMKARLNEGQQIENGLTVDGEKLLAINAIQRIYKLNDYGPLWSEKTSKQLFSEINEAVASDGLQRQDYTLPGLETMINGQQLKDLNVKDRLERELALTESLLRLSYHLRFGKVDPVTLDSNWNYGKRLDFKDPMAALYQAIKDQNVKTILDGERPSHPYYHKLQKILANYRELEAAGGWQPIETGPTIKLDHLG